MSAENNAKPGARPAGTGAPAQKPDTAAGKRPAFPGAPVANKPAETPAAKPAGARQPGNAASPGAVTGGATGGATGGQNPAAPQPIKNSGAGNPAAGAGQKPAANAGAVKPAPAAPGPKGPGAQTPRPSAPASSSMQKPVPEPATLAHIGPRHRMLALSFVLVVLAPIAITAWYLWARAADQYASYSAFTVRSEQGASASELLGGLGSLAGISGSSSSDTDILYRFILSHEMVERVDQKLDLRQIWSKPDNDPVFSYTGNELIEELLDEWERKVKVYYDDGMIELRVMAFDANDAQAIGSEILAESSAMINAINDIAREDAIGYAREDLELSVERLKEARQTMTTFRNRYQMVDPEADVEAQAGILVSLQQQLAEALINLGVLRANAQPNDPRIEQAELRVNVIREQIDEERLKFGSETADGEQLSDVVGQFEGLMVDRHFAEQTYTAALAAYDLARAEAQRQSRYLAAFVQPTLPTKAEYPERIKLLIIVSGFLLLIWMIGALVFYSLRDRR